MLISLPLKVWENNILPEWLWGPDETHKNEAHELWLSVKLKKKVISVVISKTKMNT